MNLYISLPKHIKDSTYISHLLIKYIYLCKNRKFCKSVLIEIPSYNTKCYSNGISKTLKEFHFKFRIITF